MGLMTKSGTPQTFAHQAGKEHRAPTPRSKWTDVGGAINASFRKLSASQANTGAGEQHNLKRQLIEGNFVLHTAFSLF